DNQLGFITSSSFYSSLSDNIKSRISEIKTDWQQLKDQAFELQPMDSFERYSELISDVLSVMKSVSEQSRLMTDTEAHTAFLIKVFVEELPVLAEVTGKTRGIGAGIAAKGSFTSDSFIALSNYHKLLGNIRNSVEHSLTGALQSSSKLNVLTSPINNFDSAVKSFMKETKESLLDPDEVSISSNDYFASGTQVIEKTLSLLDLTFNQLQEALAERKNGIINEVWMNIISSVALILTAIYLFSCFSSSMMDSISRIKNCVNSVADGDLTVNTDIQSSDEMRAIGEDVNAMVRNTKSLVEKVLSATNDLVDTAQNNSHSASQTSERIYQQNIEVEQVATAMNQMSATVQEVASNAEQTASSTASADNDSKAGYSIVENTINSIGSLANELEAASSSINELQNNVNGIGSVLDVIQGIADQTNLLALNAAIEAARAGESGRGFAVVADEVRTLASKTQESTEEIRQMIDKLQNSASLSVKSMISGNEKSQQTVEDAHKAGDALKQISESVGHISLMGEQIASAASEQSSVADEINRSIMSVKEISEITGKAASDSAKSSQFLNEVAGNLKQLVAQFKV
ncbi:MAG: methyl-accepting chemotaxis protein, partial [Kangiellaceae bacterium]|nr:methyl-accepting chemotaxis protein [Kangiellaceae bacterium]